MVLPTPSPARAVCGRACGELGTGKRGERGELAVEQLVVGVVQQVLLLIARGELAAVAGQLGVDHGLLLAPPAVIRGEPAPEGTPEGLLLTAQQLRRASRPLSGASRGLRVGVACGGVVRLTRAGERALKLMLVGEAAVELVCVSAEIRARRLCFSMRSMPRRS